MGPQASGDTVDQLHELRAGREQPKFQIDGVLEFGNPEVGHLDGGAQVGECVRACARPARLRRAKNLAHPPGTDPGEDSGEDTSIAMDRTHFD